VVVGALGPHAAARLGIEDEVDLVVVLRGRGLDLGGLLLRVEAEELQVLEALLLAKRGREDLGVGLLELGALVVGYLKVQLKQNHRNLLRPFVPCAPAARPPGRGPGPGCRGGRRRSGSRRRRPARRAPRSPRGGRRRRARRAGGCPTWSRGRARR